MTNSISLRRLIFFWTTWGYLLTNFLVAWFSSLSMAFMAVRESWMLLLLVLLVFNRSYLSLAFIGVIALYGAAPFAEGIQGYEVLGFIYGMRDIFLLVLLIELIHSSSDLKVSKNEIFLFIYFVLGIAIADAVTTNVLGMNVLESIFRTSSYYSNKGVDINLSNGLMGERIGAPLYSPNLLCTLLACCFFFDHRIVKGKLFVKAMALIVIAFTMTKVIVFSLGFYLVRSKWKLPTILGLTALFPLYFLLVSYYSTIPLGLLKYHLASILGHFHAFTLAIESNLLSYIPEPLGSNSIAVKIMTAGVNSGPGIESSILARFSELKIYYFIVIAFIIYSFFKIDHDVEKKFLAFFIVLSLLTATSNQPVAFIPALYLLKALK
ncbi:hypothetical protein H4J58_09660 [Colwellia sp. MB3u-70]|uniref:hypothetical protein n=1 Tax=unclassified Colwellia TaxID=196834 RepID=UPI0015F4E92F|nr:MULTISPECIES: hypothetical protein [unclassified Colwellia]MBA6292583.1 hypothetical protein [Colwellia sp. MB3u-8]MBA6307378.1 hypothetical protein [Colwellia sp. MB3u-70]